MSRISTAGIAINEGKCFMALRKPGTSIGERWEFPGGKLEPGEKPEEGLSREYLEEFNLSVRVGSLIHESSFENRGIHYQLMAFLVFIEDGELSHPEHQKICWVCPDEMRDMDMAPSDRSIASALLAKPELFT